MSEAAVMGGRMLQDGTRLVNVRIYDLLVQKDGIFLKRSRAASSGKKVQKKRVVKRSPDGDYGELVGKLKAEVAALLKDPGFSVPSLADMSRRFSRSDTDKGKQDGVDAGEPAELVTKAQAQYGRAREEYTKAREEGVPYPDYVKLAVAVEEAAQKYEEARRQSMNEEGRKYANRLKGADRAKVVVRRLVTRHGLNHMYTLTFKADMTDAVEASRHLENFLRRAKRRHPDLLYVAVPEVQEERAKKYGVRVWHYHLASNVLWRHPELMELWGQGFVFVREYDPAKGKPGAASSYLTKYLAKTFGHDAEAGKHRYHRSEAMCLPFHELLIEPGDLDAYKEALERGGFRLRGEIRELEVDGMFLGWCASSLLEDEEQARSKEPNKQVQRE